MDLRRARELLELRTGATREEISRAYRRRSFALHPDRFPGGAPAHVQEQLVELNQAYELLLSVEEFALATGPQPAGLPGVELVAKIKLPVLVSVTGGSHTAEVEVDGRLRQFKIDVPAGAAAGSRFRIRGAGGAGEPRGDLVLVVEDLQPDRFDRPAKEPLAVTTTRRVTYAQIYVGRIVSVITPWGTRMLPLRAGDVSPHRIRGCGVRVRGVDGREIAGDLVVNLEVVWPAPGNEALARALLTAQHEL